MSGNKVSFVGCNLRLVFEAAIDIDSVAELTFVDSELKLSGNTIRATAERVVFRKTTLVEPEKKALARLKLLLIRTCGLTGNGFVMFILA
jgi:hypothetical protein